MGVEGKMFTNLLISPPKLIVLVLGTVGPQPGVISNHATALEFRIASKDVVFQHVNSRLIARPILFRSLNDICGANDDFIIY